MDTMNTLRRQEKTIGNEIWQHCRACGVGSGRSCSLFLTNLNCVLLKIMIHCKHIKTKRAHKKYNVYGREYERERERSDDNETDIIAKHVVTLFLF